MQTFAETGVLYPDGQSNIAELPESLILNGFIPKQMGVRGQPLPAQYLNWLFREAFRQINLDRVKDGAGAGVIDAEAEGVVTLYAVVKTDVTKFIHAVGYKTANAAPTFKVISSATLTLGAITSSSIAIGGAVAADVALRVSVRG
jgi:hypothetical protein